MMRERHRSCAAAAAWGQEAGGLRVISGCDDKEEEEDHDGEAGSEDRGRTAVDAVIEEAAVETTRRHDVTARQALKIGRAYV